MASPHWNTIAMILGKGTSTSVITSAAEDPPWKWIAVQANPCDVSHSVGSARSNIALANAVVDTAPDLIWS